MTNTQELLERRYGRSKTKARRQVILWRTVAATLVVAFLTWGITVAIAEGEKVGASVHSYAIEANSAEVKFNLTAASPIEGSVICVVQALNQSFAVVGYREVRIAAKDASVEQTVRFNTTEQAVTAVVDHCWRG